MNKIILKNPVNLNEFVKNFSGRLSKFELGEFVYFLLNKGLKVTVLRSKDKKNIVGFESIFFSDIVLITNYIGEFLETNKIKGSVFTTNDIMNNYKKRFFIRRLLNDFGEIEKSLLKRENLLRVSTSYQ